MQPARNPIRSILITGANRGLGLALTRRYADFGHSVIAACRKPDAASDLTPLAAASQGRLELLPLDVSSEDSITAFAARLAGRGVQLDLTINNAGVSIEEPFSGWTAANFAEHFLVNTTGPALVAQAVAPLMRRGSALANISSGMGSLASNIQPEGPLDAYAASKAALNLLTRRLAAKFAPQGVTVVAINPGWVQTEMGGPDAPDTPEEVAATIANTLERLTPNKNGGFFEQNGDRAFF